MKSKYKAKILQGHFRPIKDIKFSKDGNFIFSASADRTVIKWDSKTNTKILTFSHQASVNVIAVSSLSNILFSGDSTGNIYIWNTSNITNDTINDKKINNNDNKLLNRINFESKYNIRSIDLSTNEENILITFAERAKISPSFLSVFLIKDLLKNSSFPSRENLDIPKSISKIECDLLNTKFIKSRFINMNKNILVSREDGYLQMFNYPQGLIISSQKFHNNEILDFDINEDHSLIITSSKDGEMSLINLTTFQLVNKFKPTNPIRNLNSCKIAIIKNPFYLKHPCKKISVDSLFAMNDLNDLNLINEEKNKKIFQGNKKEIILAIVAGGQDSKFVTTTGQKEGGFDIVIYDVFGGEMLINFLEHFGPVNALDVNQETLASGAEDATVRIHSLNHYLFEEEDKDELKK